MDKYPGKILIMNSTNRKNTASPTKKWKISRISNFIVVGPAYRFFLYIFLRIGASKLGKCDFTIFWVLNFILF